MLLSFETCLVVALIGINGKPDRRGVLFDRWQKTQRSVPTLVVEFTLEQSRFGWRPEKFVGSFRLLRTPNGEVFASYTTAPCSGSSTPRGRCSRRARSVSRRSPACSLTTPRWESHRS